MRMITAPVAGLHIRRNQHLADLEGQRVFKLIAGLKLDQ